MRSAGEIRTELLKLRDLRHLPKAHICENARVSAHELISAFKLEATELTLLKLDAYLNAPQLHVRKKHSERIYRFEQYDRELYMRWKAKSIHVLTFQDKTRDEQERTLSAMDYRCKRLMIEEYARKGIALCIPDGLNYWKARKYVEEKQALVAKKRDASRILRQNTARRSRFL